MDDIVSGWDAGDLPRHGVYPTYFEEFAFYFSGAETAQYDTMDDPGGPVGPCLGDNCMYYVAFDVSEYLDPGYHLHFDLYNVRIRGEDRDKAQFAPFSHDAEIVPEPSTVLLLGAGMLGLWVFKRRFVFSPDRGTKKK